ncbi:MAG TPA: hypothetical protein VGD63_04405 [Steroidobacteraceae bacterium]
MNPLQQPIRLCGTTLGEYRDLLYVPPDEFFRELTERDTHARRA